MVKNVYFLLKRLIKSGIMVLLFCLILYFWFSETADTDVASKRDMRSSFGPFYEETTSADFMTTEQIATTTESIENSSLLYSFDYIHLPPQICESDGGPFDPFLVILVKSSVLNIGHREAIRSTWAKFKNPNIKLVFLLGYSPLIKQFINMENSIYKDLVQQNFIDDYFNNTLKTIMGFDWIIKHCAKTRFIYFVDDDYFVNLPKLLDFIDFNVKKKTKNLIAGHKYVGAIPRRKRDSKWYVSWEDYPQKTWPPYLSGGSMIMDMSVAKRIYDQIPYTKQIFIDDVFLGIVAKSLDLELLHERRFSVRYTPDKLGKLYSAHRYGSPRNLILEWRKVRCQYKKMFKELYGEPKCQR